MLVLMSAGTRRNGIVGSMYELDRDGCEHA